MKDGAFKADDYGKFSHMGVGGCTLADMDAKLVPAEVVTKVRARQAEIMSGKLQVAVDDAEPKPTN